MKYPSFKFREFIAPEFTMEKGKMVRFWVQIVPENEKRSNGYLAAKKIFKQINNHTIQVLEDKIYLCPGKLKMRFIDHFKSITVGDYLDRVLGESSNEIKKEIEAFDIMSEYSCKKMESYNQKILSIICGIEQNEVVSFDFYGLGPKTEVELMKYIHTKLDKGKSILAFDNLDYKEVNFDKKNIDNLIIHRTKNNL